MFKLVVPDAEYWKSHKIQFIAPAYLDTFSVLAGSYNLLPPFTNRFIHLEWPEESP